MNILWVVTLGLVAVAAAPSKPDRIVGGSATTINRYPFSAVLLYSSTTVAFIHHCGGTIVNNRAILTAAHCLTLTARFRTRVGSTYSNRGGVVHNSERLLPHPSYRQQTMDSDVAIVRISGTFSFNANVGQGRVAGSNYNLADREAVWAIGWGATSSGGLPSQSLRHVQVWTINQATCRERYGARGRTITDNMLCSGVIDVGGRDQCQGDSGSPLLHNNVAVGVCSFGRGCASPRYPGVNARVSRFATWIQNNS